MACKATTTLSVPTLVHASAGARSTLLACLSMPWLTLVTAMLCIFCPNRATPQAATCAVSPTIGVNLGEAIERHSQVPLPLTGGAGSECALFEQ